MEKQMLGYLAVLAVGFFGKLLWDWVTAGRIQKEVPYVTVAACEACREKCCVVQLKHDTAGSRMEYEAHKAEMDERMRAVEKRLDQGSEDFRELKRELSAIKEVLAGMKVMIETKIEKIVVREPA